jgi:hypothetical protein
MLAEVLVCCQRIKACCGRGQGIILEGLTEEYCCKTRRGGRADSQLLLQLEDAATVGRALMLHSNCKQADAAAAGAAAQVKACTTPGTVLTRRCSRCIHTSTHVLQAALL